ncbi:nucleotidyltransferase [Thermincola ferriacetica]|uniref:Nucleotidyltransferase n=1 Tax=Thermincola ferriacetica TaxID=281456 RepID=A0A0L6W386_9FIRM|nr:nucleotidyltransferase family protein [Thermincola ferriacetica]KNZ70042.1 nucleotidyltransferase [Thermincola ferriacetica]
MKAMIMAAGVGSRLDPLTRTLPKPMVPIQDKPLMEHIINLLRHYGIRDIIANLHYLPGVIKSYFGDGSDFGVKLLYSEEQNLMGTAGGVKNNEWFLDETFVVISGDALTDIDLADFVRYHRQKKALATIALKRVAEVERFGVVVTGEAGKIAAFQEKPRKEEALSNLVNTGIYIFEPEIFKYIPEHQVYDFGKQLFPLLVKEGLPFYGYPMDGYWRDIGTLESYRQAREDAACGKVKLGAALTKPRCQHSIYY